MDKILSLSILNANFCCLADECNDILNYGADWLHIDIMDGHFVPNLGIGLNVISSLRNSFKNTFFDCHLMTSEPMKWIDVLHKNAVNSITFHIETVKNITDGAEICKKIKCLDILCGIALCPETDVSSIFHYVDKGLVNMIVIMTVNPGFGGQKLITSCLEKVSILRKMYPKLHIQVDGGVDLTNIDNILNAGANLIVVGSLIFKANDKKSVIQSFKQKINCKSF